MTFIKQPEKEGEEMKCPLCGMDLIARLKEYKDYPSKVQWQNKSHTKAHFDKDGNCSGTQTTDTQTITTTSSNTPEGNIEPNSFTNILDEATTKIIQNETILLHSIRKIILTKAKEFEKDPNPAMIGQYVGLIWEKYFSHKKERSGTDVFDD